MPGKSTKEKLAQLKQSILQIQGQVGQVTELFEEIAGEPIDKPEEPGYNEEAATPKKKRGRPKKQPVVATAEPKDDRNDFIAPIKGRVQDADEDFDGDDVESASADDEAKNFCRRTPFRRSGREKNRFVDDLTEELVDSKGESLLTSVNPKAGVMVRRRPESKERAAKVKVVCSICDKEEIVSKSLAYGYRKDKPGTKIQDRKNTYKCNECNSSRGRLKQARLENERA